MKKTAILLLLAWVSPGCVKQAPDAEQFRADETRLVKATVADAARAERLLALFEERDRLIEETGALLRQYRREFKAINAEYDTGREVHIEMVDYYNRGRAQKQLRFIELITQMKAATSATEWRVIAEFQLDNFDPRRQLFGRIAGDI